MTEQEKQAVIDKYLGKKIPLMRRASVAKELPPELHIAENDGGLVKYRNGMHPNSRKNLQPEKYAFQPGQSGNPEGGRLHKKNTKPLQAAFRELLNTEKPHFYRKRVNATVADQMAEMSLIAMIKSFKRGIKSGDLRDYNRLSAEFRLAAGEIPTQETDNVNRNEYQSLENASVTNLLKQVSFLLSRAMGDQLPAPDKEVNPPNPHLITEAKFKEIKDE